MPDASAPALFVGLRFVGLSSITHLESIGKGPGKSLNAPAVCSRWMGPGLQAGLMGPRLSQTPRSCAPKARQRLLPSSEGHRQPAPPQRPSPRPTLPCGTTWAWPRRAQTSARTAVAPPAARTRPPGALLQALAPAVLTVGLRGLGGAAGLRHPPCRRLSLLRYQAEDAAKAAARLPSATTAAEACCARRHPPGVSRHLKRASRLRVLRPGAPPMLALQGKASLRTGCAPHRQAPPLPVVLPPAADWA